MTLGRETQPQPDGGAQAKTAVWREGHLESNPFSPGQLHVRTGGLFQHLTTFCWVMSVRPYMVCLSRLLVVGGALYI